MNATAVKYTSIMGETNAPLINHSGGQNYTGGYWVSPATRCHTVVTVSETLPKSVAVSQPRTNAVFRLQVSSQPPPPQEHLAGQRGARRPKTVPAAANTGPNGRESCETPHNESDGKLHRRNATLALMRNTSRRVTGPDFCAQVKRRVSICGGSQGGKNTWEYRPPTLLLLAALSSAALSGEQ